MEFLVGTMSGVYSGDTNRIPAGGAHTILIVKTDGFA